MTSLRVAHAFDWVITTDEGLLHWVESDLDGFFSRERLVLDDKVVIDQPTRTQFLHEFPLGAAFDEAYEKNAGRYAAFVERWRALMKSGRRVLFVRQHGWSADARAAAVRLRDALAARAPYLRFDLLYLTPDEQEDWGETRIINRHLLQPEPYVWTGDDDAWRKILSGDLALPDQVAKTDATSVRHIFICGLHRSGTSPLHDIIKAHPETTGFRDTGAPRDEGQHLQSVVERDEAFGGPGLFGFDAGARLTETDISRYATRLATLRAQWQRWWADDRAIRVEKSPPNVVRTRFLQEAFADARFVFIVRHPIAVARATAKWTRTSIEQALRHWLAAHHLMLEDARYLRRSVCLRYEDLAANLDSELPRVWTLMGVPPTDIDPAAFRDHNSAYLSEVRPVELDWRDRRLLAHFGYSLTAPFVSTDHRFGW